MSKKEAFYNNLKTNLNKNHAWPSVYMFKFIVPDNPELLTAVQRIFSAEAILDYKTSSAGKYISITGKEMMMSAEDVIQRYLKAEKIEGIIML